MVFERIEQLKRQYTDKYVVVDDSRPELRRFHGMTGTVKTVNMSGRALVEFDAYNNIGWYDIDVNFLKVIDAPLPKPEAKPARAEKPAAKAEKQASAGKSAKAERPASQPAAGGSAGKMSVDEILKAARSGGTAKGAPKPTTPSAEKPSAPQSAAAVDPRKMTVDQILAAARANKAGGAAPVKAEAKPASTARAEGRAAPAPATPVDPKKMSTADILAAARGKKPAAAPPPESAADSPQESMRDTTTMSTADILAAARRPSSKDAEQSESAAAEPVAPEPAAESASPTAGPSSTVDRASLPQSTADIVAWCRSHDAQ